MSEVLHSQKLVHIVSPLKILPTVLGISVFVYRNSFAFFLLNLNIWMEITKNLIDWLKPHNLIRSLILKPIHSNKFTPGTLFNNIEPALLSNELVLQLYLVWDKQRCRLS